MARRSLTNSQEKSEKHGKSDKSVHAALALSSVLLAYSKRAIHVAPHFLAVLSARPQFMS